jgi:hypothetical protein
MVELMSDAVDDLAAIGESDGRAEMVMLFKWCKVLDEASTRAEAERLSSEGNQFRLKVGNYNIVYELDESSGDDIVRIKRVRRRRGPFFRH